MGSSLTEQQLAAVQSVDKNVLVSAGAGSGKTHVLVERYVEILRQNPDITLGGIIAVTFTRKAAAEMRSRLKAKFLALSNDPAEAAYVQRWRECLAEVDSARINTIHSLCESVLKTFPADSGIDPEFEMLDDLIGAEMRQEAVEQAIRETISQAVDKKDSAEINEDEPVYQLLLDFPLGELQEKLAKLLENTMQFEESLEAFGEPTLDNMMAFGRRFMQRIKAETLAKITGSNDAGRAMFFAENNPFVSKKPPNNLEEARLAVLSYWQSLSAADTTTETGLDSAWRALTELGLIETRTYGGPDGKVLRDQLKVVRDMAKEATKSMPADLDAVDERSMRCSLGVIALFKRAKKHYQAAKERRNALDYNDQIARARYALERPDSQARAYFNEKTRALLIDEFQDTNDIQTRLLFLLAGPTTRIFLIGDDKQSIYKFQGADVSTFNRWKQRLSVQNDQGLNGENMVSKLTMSFRSHPLVVHFVNALFARLLDGDPTRLDYVAAFEALQPARAIPAHETAAAAASGEEVVPATDVILFDEDEENDPPAARIEAAQVALWIKEKVESGFLIEAKGGKARPIEYGDFAVLFNRNTDFASFEEIFSRVNIPYVAFGGLGFLLRQEVADFENLMRFLENPQDSHALLAVLRSPLCPITDDMIHRVVTEAEGDSKAPLWARLIEANDRRVAGYESIMQAVRVLRTMLDYSSQLPLGELVHKVIDLTRYDLSVLASNDGKQRSRNIWKIAQMARDNESLSCGEFALRLAAMRDMKLKQAEAPLDSRNAVKLMTIHASKGLEFPAVALPCLGGQLAKTGDRFTFHKSFGCAFNTKRLKNDDAPAWYQMTSGLTRAMEVEERKRLLYVAMTRARDCLGIFLRHTVRRESDSYRKWLLDHLNLRVGIFSVPEPGTRVVCELNSHGHEARFSVSHCIGMPPGLDLRAESNAPVLAPDEESARALAAAADPGNIGSFWEEPLLSTFETPPNEMAFVRLTPKQEKIEGGENFAALAPRVVGTFFHALMENLPLTRSVDREWVRDIAYNQGFHFVHPERLEALVDDGMRLLEIYRGSRLADIVSNSHSRFTEMPYLVNDLEAVNEADDSASVMTMRPDLLVEAADGDWHLVDFKTDHFDTSLLDQQARKHRHQLMRYVNDLQAMGNVQIKPALYFAQYGIFYPLA